MVFSLSLFRIPHTPLYDALAADSLGNAVGSEEQRYADQGFGNADHRGKRDLVLPDTDVIYIQVQDLDHVLVHGVFENQILFHTIGQDSGNAHQEHNHIGRHQSGDRDMPDAAEAVCTVHFCSLIQLLVDSGDPGNIDDGTPSDALPGAPQQHFQPGVVRNLQVVCVCTGLVQHIGQETVDESVCGKNADRDRVYKHPGDEVRDGSQRLDRPLEFAGPDFSQQHRKGDRKPGCRDAQPGHDQGLKPVIPTPSAFPKASFAAKRAA